MYYISRKLQVITWDFKTMWLVKIQIVWGIAPCRIVNTNVSKLRHDCIFRVKVCIFPRKLGINTKTPWERHISQCRMYFTDSLILTVTECKSDILIRTLERIQNVTGFKGGRPDFVIRAYVEMLKLHGFFASSNVVFL